MTAPMPASLLSDEGTAWLLRCKLLKQAFDERDNGNYFCRSTEVQEAYESLSPADFVERFA